MEFTVENFISDKLLNDDLSNLKKGEKIFDISFYTDDSKRMLVCVYDAENLAALYYKVYKKDLKAPSIFMYGEIELNKSAFKVNIFDKNRFTIQKEYSKKQYITELIMKLLTIIFNEKEQNYFNKEKNQKSLESNLSLTFSFDSNRYFLYHNEINNREISGMLFLGDKIVYLFGDKYVFLEQRLFNEVELSTVFKERKIKEVDLKKSEKELFFYSLSDFLFNNESKNFIFDFNKLVNKTNDIIESI